MIVRLAVLNWRRIILLLTTAKSYIEMSQLYVSWLKVIAMSQNWGIVIYASMHFYFYFYFLACFCFQLTLLLHIPGWISCFCCVSDSGSDLAVSSDFGTDVIGGLSDIHSDVFKLNIAVYVTAAWVKQVNSKPFPLSVTFTVSHLQITLSVMMITDPDMLLTFCTYFSGNLQIV